MCSFNRGNTEGTNSSKICVWCLCLYVLFYVCVGIVFWTDLRKPLSLSLSIYIYERFCSVRLLMTDFNSMFLRWPRVVDRTLKSSFYLTHSFKRHGYLTKNENSAKVSALHTSRSQRVFTVMIHRNAPLMIAFIKRYFPLSSRLTALSLHVILSVTVEF